MSRKVYVNPPPTARTMFIAQIVVVGLFLLFGVSFVFIAEGEARPYVAAFSVIWVVACIALIVHAVKALRLIKKGRIEVARIGDAATGTESDFAARLRDLEALKREGLISDEEYRKKRAGIMSEKW